jgi:hypothetical protein
MKETFSALAVAAAELQALAALAKGIDDALHAKGLPPGGTQAAQELARYIRTVMGAGVQAMDELAAAGDRLATSRASVVIVPNGVDA